jgi:hypothetical protein
MRKLKPKDDDISNIAQGILIYGNALSFVGPNVELLS